MILRKPYAFFIKMFKPIHLLLSILVLYLIFLSNNILKFLNNYIYSLEDTIDKSVIGDLSSNLLYIIPIIVIVLFLLLLSVMYKKNKSTIFYFVGIFSFVGVIVINVYSVNFLNILVDNIISVKSIKLIHDLVLINVIIESVAFIFLFIRGIGIDFKKFDFDSDISKLQVSDSDREEIEISVNIDFNERKRKRREKLRNLKYSYIENRLLINSLFIVFIGLVVFVIVYFINKSNDVNKEGIYYESGVFNFKVNNTTILNTDYQGKKLTDNYIIVVNTNLRGKYTSKSLYLNDFSLKIEDITFKPVRKYFKSLIDLGNFYDGEILPLEYTDYLFAFEIPEKYINSDLYFSYNNEGNIVNILLEPKKIINSELQESVNINETIKFEGALEGVEFKINNYEIKDKILIEYKYCIKENDCILSKEYLRPSINENYDKVIIKIDVDYKSDSSLDVDNFYKLLNKFGMISYKVNDVWYNSYVFEEITSKKVSGDNSSYIGINSKILDADSIKIIFDIRGMKYEYLLK